MTKRSVLAAAVIAAGFTAAGDVPAAPLNDSGQAPADTVMLLAQGDGGGGDSAGRGPDTSKGAVPEGKEKAYPSGEYPSGITSPGTAPTPGAPAAGSSAAPTTPPGTQGGGAPGTGLGSPGTTQKGGTTRTDK